MRFDRYPALQAERTADYARQGDQHVPLQVPDLRAPFLRPELIGSEGQDLFPLRVEIDAPLFEIGDVTEMRCLRRAVPDEHISIGALA